MKYSNRGQFSCIFKSSRGQKRDENAENPTQIQGAQKAPFYDIG